MTLAYGGLAGWNHQRRAFLTESYLDLIEGLEKEDLGSFEKVNSSIAEFGSLSPVATVANSIRFVSQSLKDQYQKSETSRRLALLGMILEQHFQQHRSYPADLDEIEISFPIVDLTDPGGRDLDYQIGKDGRPEIEASGHKKRGSGLRWQFWYDEPVRRSRPRKKRGHRRSSRKIDSGESK